MLEAAEAHGIVPLVCREVLARPGLLTAEARHSLAGAQQAAAVRALDAFRELRDVLRHLEAADIHALPYKGPVLAFDAYGDVTMRDSADLDIVVAAPDIDRAAAVLGAHGYRPADGRAWRDARATNEWQAQVTLRRDGGRLPLDVHWRFCDRKLPWSPGVAGVLARGVDREVGGAHVTVPTREDQVMLVLLHAARHGWDRLDGLVAAGALMARGVDARLLAQRAAEIRGTTVVATGCALIRRLFGTVVDPDAPSVVPSVVPSVAPFAVEPRRVAALAAIGEARLRRGDAGATRDARLHLQLLDGVRDRVRYVALALVLPTDADDALLRLPRGLGWLYPIARPWRLAARAARAARR